MTKMGSSINFVADEVLGRGWVPLAGAKTSDLYLVGSTRGSRTNRLLDIDQKNKEQAGTRTNSGSIRKKNDNHII